MEALKPRESGPVPAPREYPNELRERALRLVNEAMAEDPELSLNATVHQIGPKVHDWYATARHFPHSGWHWRRSALLHRAAAIASMTSVLPCRHRTCR
jgi:hypothetical protein